MRKNLQFAGVTALLLSSAACGGQEIILSNYPGNDATSSTVDSLINGSKAMGFTMPDSPYFIYFEVTLRLDILEQGTQPRVEVFDDVGGTPGVSLATLLSPTIDTVGLGDFTFKQDSMVWLEPSESYWLVVSAESGWFNWMASDPPQDPSIWAQHLGSVWGTYPPSEPSSIWNTYYLEAWYPAPGTLAGLGIGVLALRRRGCEGSL